MTEILFPPGFETNTDFQSDKRPGDRPLNSYDAEDRLAAQAQEVDSIIDCVKLAGGASFEALCTAFEVAGLDEASRVETLMRIDMLGYPIEGGIPDSIHPQPAEAVNEDPNRPLATPTKEVLRKAAKLPLLTPHQEKLLGYRTQNGDMDARNKLVEHNLRLVASLIRPYMHRGLDKDDLFMEGVLGLNCAAETFDPYKGYRFTTYAAQCIKRAVTRAVDKKGATISIPEYLHRRGRSIRQASESIGKVSLGSGLNHEADNDELSEMTGLKPSEINEVHKALRVKSVSLNEIIDDKSEGGLLGEIDYNFEITENEVAENQDAIQRKQALKDALTDLSDRDQKMLELRFGLGGQEPMTFKQAGEALGISASRVGQLEKNVMKQMSTNLKLKEAWAHPDFRSDKGEEGFDEILEKKGIPSIDGLTARLTLVAYYLSKGKSNPEIGLELGVGIGSVKDAVRTLYTHLGIDKKALQPKQKRGVCKVELEVYFGEQEQLAA